MLKNKLVQKLSINVALLLLLFALIMSASFLFLFRHHTMTLHENELMHRANTMATSLAVFLEDENEKAGYGAYMSFLGDIAGADVWLIDQEHRLITAGHGKGRLQPYEYGDLPEDAETLIDAVLAGNKVSSKDLSGFLSEPTQTVGVPISTTDGNIVGAVLLHSSVNGVNEAVQQSIIILLGSIAIALLLSVIVSIWMSKRFTDPITQKQANDAIRMEKIRQDFVANVSHELRTPVTVLKGSLEALCDKIVCDPIKIESYHQQMLLETTHLERLVGDLLDLSKLQQREFVIEKQPLSLGDVLDDAMFSARQLATAKQVCIQVDPCNASRLFFGDYVRLRQLFLIILDNAIKFSPPHGVVRISRTPDAIEVKDRGAGICPEELPDIFDRFYQSPENQNKSGSGLGLAIAKQIADRHGISLHVTSVLGTGTTVRLQFPKTP